MSDENDAFQLMKKEVMDIMLFWKFWRFQMKLKFLRSWILHSLAYSSPSSNFSVQMQKARGVKIGKICHFNPYVLIDLIYPQMVEIGNNVTLGSNSMIFAHSNPSANLFMKQGEFPRKFQMLK